ncbi:MAG: dTDP-4-dehydrorhamnose 3,5-epimerase [Gemmatimonadota bacterium]|nr:dTDP-4-dehydrorhamnose 3,5-epimerase [Gemmatimonadota bacterium]
MIFHETPLPGAFVLEPEPIVDERGSFARTFSADEFAARGLETSIVQCNLSVNTQRGTLRGMHYQAAPYDEAKVVSCVRGALYDVIVDLRPESPTYCRWFGVELTVDNGRQLYVPKGFAHGFQTLVDETAVSYLMSERYSPAHARGVRWDDPVFAIEWPEAERIISPKDRSYPDFVA